MNTAKFFVYRRNTDGREGYIGPLPRDRAEREAQAWRDCEEWSASVLPITLELRNTVRAWEDSRPAFSAGGQPIARKPRKPLRA